MHLVIAPAAAVSAMTNRRAEPTQAQVLLVSALTLSIIGVVESLLRVSPKRSLTYDIVFTLLRKHGSLIMICLLSAVVNLECFNRWL